MHTLSEIIQGWDSLFDFCANRSFFDKKDRKSEERKSKERKSEKAKSEEAKERNPNPGKQVTQIFFKLIKSEYYSISLASGEQCSHLSTQIVTTGCVKNMCGPNMPTAVRSRFVKMVY